MTDFLLELRSEEIPARMQAGARASLDKLFREAMAAAGVLHGDITVWSTPRRLALIARDLPDATAAVSEEVKGPRTSAPAQALDGFLRKTGLTREQLIERDGVWFAVSEKPGRATAEVLAEAIPAIVRAFPWPKSMRWGAASLRSDSLRWVRPLSCIVAILGEDLVACEVGGIASAYQTRGHRFHHPDPITIGGAHDYADKLRLSHVIVNHEERKALIRDGARAAAAEAGLALVEDEGLVIENAGLTEWPVPLLGRFDPAFLEVPPEVIQLTARTNQKYFVCESPLPLAGGAGGGPVLPGALPDQPTPDPSRKREGSTLADAFVCTANIAAHDGGAGVVDGNRKVLAARLSDARFFWEQDRRKTLAQHAAGLSRITFHEKLGTVADKVERVAKLARWLVEEGIVGNPPRLRGGGSEADGGGSPTPQPLASSTAPSVTSPSGDAPPPRAGEDRKMLADMAEQAARLCKADLVTEMVGEFPELQGVMGGYYARAERLPDEVADAIRDHYKPVGQGDEVPTAPVTVAVALADKLDTLVGFFAYDMQPTGSRDPFALRRAAISILAIVIVNNLSIDVTRIARNVIAHGVVQPIEHRKQYDAFFSRFMELAWPEFPEPSNLIMERAQKVLNEQPDVQPYFDILFGEFLVTFASVLENRRRTIGLLTNFLIDRLKVQQREAGVRHDLIDAVFALGNEDDLVRLLARVHALQAFVGTEDGANLLAGYKRAANILRKEEYAGAPSSSKEGMKRLSYTPEPAEKALTDALDAAAPRAAEAVAAEDFAGAMTALAMLRAPIDAFFEDVTVNDPDPAKREARLALLARFRAAVHNVADFSKIEG